MIINAEAERFVLGAMLANNGIILDVQRMLAPDDFTGDANKRIYETILKLYAKKVPADIQSTWIEIKDFVKPGYIAELTDGVSVGAWAQSAEKIRNAALRRRYAVLATRLLETCKNENDNFPEITKLVGEISTIHDSVVRASGRKIAEVCSNVINDIELARKNKEKKMNGLPTGFTKIDSIIDGLHKEFILIAARTSKGKSAFALNIANNLVTAGYKPAYFTLEMSAEECVQRMVSTDSNIGTRRLEYGTVSEGDNEKILKAMGKIFDSGIVFDDGMGQTIFDIAAKIKAYVRIEKCNVIFIDHFALIRSTDTRMPRTEQCSFISKQIMALVKELKVPIIVVSQLNRIAENETPQLSHLSESGYLEQDAQCIMLFDRDRYLEEGKITIDTHVNVAKNRHGPTGMVELDFYPEIVTFRDSDRVYIDEQKKKGK